MTHKKAPDLVPLLRELAAFQHSDVSLAGDAADCIEDLALIIKRMVYAAKHGHDATLGGAAMDLLGRYGLLNNNHRKTANAQNFIDRR